MVAECFSDAGIVEVFHRAVPNMLRNCPNHEAPTSRA
jgi:hypothetical protein